MTSPHDCFHCGEAIPVDSDFNVTINDITQQMCCIGCEAVAQSIVDNGLVNYYKHRTEKGVQATELVPEQLRQLQSYDITEIEQEFTFSSGETKEVLLTVENVTCAACAWLIEGQLVKLDGLIKCNVNTTTSRISLTWDGSKLKLSEILLAIAKIGYKAYPFQPDKAEQQEVETTKAYLRKLIVAGLATMQVMMFAIASYFDALGTLSDGLNDYFRWISLILAVPVVFYSSLPFYQNSISALGAKRLNMDVPVSIAILLAFFASAWATYTNAGEVYFESVCMFAFFLLLGRFFEQRAKKKAAESSSNLLKLIPATALKLVDEDFIDVPAKTLQPGDIILVKPGQTIPADGQIVAGQSHSDEAVLTGEQMPVSKQINDWVYASTINIDSPIRFEVKVERSNQLITQIIRLQEQASQDKPYLATLADRLSQYVVVGILLLASFAYIGWSLAGNPDAFWIALAVLVATCPCALSLATPSAYTAAGSAMTKLGMLLKRGNALDTLTKVNHICFDKTGTLTTGKFRVSQLDTALERTQVLSLIAALEAESQHPIAAAFSQYFNNDLRAINVKSISGAGIEGDIDGDHYKLGHNGFIGLSSVDDKEQQQRVVIYLSKNDEHIATCYLEDDIREASEPLITYLSSHNIETTLLTGDNSTHALFVGDKLGVNQVERGNTPSQKLNYLNTLQTNPKKVVAMFGDGVNDAPVLAGAPLSFAMGTGSDIAKSSADIVLLHDDLSKVADAIDLAKKVKRIIIQNFCWALGYNLTAVPFALIGLLPPWLAALGMSLSSLIVVVNSLRLLKVKS
ncbi:heavy metal translocating P-type ATPase [Psychrobium sp. 1_MG-2023]|uniref:heavy metal translocating P-type ATPase n=1 Tax=Psychrobium sp. 1_MG-2023 TaxID=3062624 RepID=UPI000C33A9A6|nr:heavy metal translocating P-type ATPase [Psychrobium sp. 1_MG-2023]MDP2561546.1 heavy metal translocating P-type ATPase [Psychrobium sp. 1_MG-2023]PKF55009.1 ATPase P [Alteromonadales bacterium alter-6D02]